MENLGRLNCLRNFLSISVQDGKSLADFCQNILVNFLSGLDDWTDWLSETMIGLSIICLGKC